MRKNDDLKEIFKGALELIVDIPDPFKTKAFEIAVNQILSSKSQEDRRERLSSPDRLPIKVDGGFFERMKEQLAIEVKALKTVYKLDKDGKIKVISPLSGNDAEKQRQLALIYLLAKILGFEKEWTSALEFAGEAKLHGINDGHISDNLDKDGTILKSGKKRGKEYGLTPGGIEKAKELLKKLVKA